MCFYFCFSISVQHSVCTYLPSTPAVVCYAVKRMFSFCRAEPTSTSATFPCTRSSLQNATPPSLLYVPPFHSGQKPSSLSPKHTCHSLKPNHTNCSSSRLEQYLGKHVAVTMGTPMLKCLWCFDNWSVNKTNTLYNFWGLASYWAKKVRVKWRQEVQEARTQDGRAGWYLRVSHCSCPCLPICLLRAQGGSQGPRQSRATTSPIWQSRAHPNKI